MSHATAKVWMSSARSHGPREALGRARRHHRVELRPLSRGPRAGTDGTRHQLAHRIRKEPRDSPKQLENKACMYRFRWRVLATFVAVCDQVSEGWI